VVFVMVVNRDQFDKGADAFVLVKIENCNPGSLCNVKLKVPLDHAGEIRAGGAVELKRTLSRSQ